MIPSGRIELLQDITKNPKSFIGSSVRVTGYLSAYDPNTNRGIIEYKDAQLHLCTNLTPLSYERGTLIQCIGEMEWNEDDQYIQLRPRVVRQVQMCNMDLLEMTAQMLHQELLANEMTDNSRSR